MAVRVELYQRPMETFYDHHPFDYLGDVTIDQEKYKPLPLLMSLLHTVRGKLVVDVGCGSGNDVGYAARVGLQIVGLDLSLRSLQIMQARYKQAAVCASNGALPLQGGSVHCIMSSGVIHHTAKPDQSFAELARVVKPGGYLYLAVYKDRGRYRFSYTFVGAVLRLLVNKAGKLGRMSVHSTALPVYWLAHKFKSHGCRDWAGATSLFYDYFITPVVHFLPKDMILKWANDADLVLTGYDNNDGLNVHSFVFHRKAL